MTETVYVTSWRDGTVSISREWLRHYEYKNGLSLFTDGVIPENVVLDLIEDSLEMFDGDVTFPSLGDAEAAIKRYPFDTFYDYVHEELYFMCISLDKCTVEVDDDGEESIVDSEVIGYYTGNAEVKGIESKTYKVLIPTNEDEYDDGEGEEASVIADGMTVVALDTHEFYDEDAVYTAVLNGDSRYYPALKRGSRIPIEMRGYNTPVVPYEWLFNNFANNED